MKFRLSDGTLGLVMRIKCLVLTRFEELKPVTPPESDKLIWLIETHPKEDAFHTLILFLVVNPQTRGTALHPKRYSFDNYAFMNYAYRLKGIDKQITSETNLNQFVEEMVVGDGLFQFYTIREK